MERRRDKFLLVIVILALVMSPVRSAFALALGGSPGELSHCAGMPHAMHAEMRTDAIRHPAGACAGQYCGQGCDRLCCGGACSHPPVAVTGAVPRFPDASGHHRYSVNPHRYPGRSITPLFRPPIALPG